DMYVSIELVEEVIERQLKKYKNKLIDKKRNAADFAPEYVDEDEEIFEEEEVKIIRAKKFGIKPMNAEEACVQMELLGHEFYVFLNSDTNEVNVVYKRRDGAYGLIEPELD
ncbi:MAG: sigma 54 modulation/S30EA ribosomal C-terminal domain-containing protein, partial [Lachnospiraceae bacterium]|nr:sigma 54 modulation/S30EA ribosomal C-terminal domain-containing protein [Lachnospiraceae bacterium]